MSECAGKPKDMTGVWFLRSHSEPGNLQGKMRGKTQLLEVTSDNVVLQVGENPFLTAWEVKD